MNKSLTSLLLITVGLIALSAIKSEATLITVSIQFDTVYFVDTKAYDVDDETTLVKDLAIKFLYTAGKDTNLEHYENLRLENKFFAAYDLNKTLKNAGIKNNQTVYLKLHSRLYSAGETIMTPFFIAY